MREKRCKTVADSARELATEFGEAFLPERDFHCFIADHIRIHLGGEEDVAWFFQQFLEQRAHQVADDFVRVVEVEGGVFAAGFRFKGGNDTQQLVAVQGHADVFCGRVVVCDDCEQALHHSFGFSRAIFDLLRAFGWGDFREKGHSAQIERRHR